MVIESGILQIKVGGEAAFEAAVSVARTALEGAKGCQKFELRRCIETPTNYQILVWWDSVEDHVAFNNSEQFGAWIGPIGDFIAAPPSLYHYGDPV